LRQKRESGRYHSNPTCRRSKVSVLRIESTEQLAPFSEHLRLVAPTSKGGLKKACV
jgi:hypothetical protein